MKKSYIQIDEHYRITSDSRQWIIERLSTPKKEGRQGTWKAVHFYTQWGSMIKHMKDKLLRESRYDSFADLQKNSAEICAVMDKLHGDPGAE